MACKTVFAFGSAVNVTDCSVPSFFLILIVPVHVMLMSIAVPAMWLLVRAGAFVLVGGTARPKPSIISFAPFLLFSASPWSHSMSTPIIVVASEGLALPRPIRQHQWNRYARLSLRLVVATETVAPASCSALMNAFALVRNGS